MARAKETKRKYYVNFEDVPLKEFMLRNSANAIKLREELISLMKEKEENNKNKEKKSNSSVHEIKNIINENSENKRDSDKSASNEASKKVEEPINSPKEWKERENIIFDSIIDSDIAEEMVCFAEKIRRSY